MRVTSVALMLTLALGACGRGDVVDSGAPPSPSGPTASVDRTPSPTSPRPAPPSESPRAPSALVTLLEEDPVIEPVGEASYVNPGAAVVLDDHIELFTNSFSSFPGAVEVHRWSSVDGRDWALTSPDPVFTSEHVPFADSTVFVYSIDVGDQGWTAWFYTFERSDRPGFIGRATAPSPDGPWTADAEPVLTPGEEDAWDGLRLAEPTVVRDGEGYRMYYAGFDGSGDGAIGLATSPDGIVWTKHDDPATPSVSDPVLTPRADWEGGTIARPRVVRDAQGWLLLYTTPARGTTGAGIALSDHGIEWERHPDNPVLVEGDLPELGAVFQQGLVATDGGLLWLLESGSGAATALHALRLASPGVAG